MNSKSLFKPPTTKLLKAGRVTLAPGETVGEHVTDQREEVLVILKGTATVHVEGTVTTVPKGQTHYIKEGQKHNVVNNGTENLEYVYVVALFPEPTPSQAPTQHQSPA
ncbi:MAG: cupin domain-containing protein [Nanoarchaeota archaeon]|nr:cupin domain-containing protein [Nanoarchaeota archaeon]